MDPAELSRRLSMHSVQRQNTTEAVDVDERPGNRERAPLHGPSDPDTIQMLSSMSRQWTGDYMMPLQMLAVQPKPQSGLLSL